MNDYSHPFFVRGSKGTFCGARDGYLLPLELPEQEVVIAYTDMEWTPRQWTVIQQLRGQVAYLQSKYQQQVSERKQSGKFFIQKA